MYCNKYEKSNCPCNSGKEYKFCCMNKEIASDTKDKILPFFGFGVSHFS
ncbi:SEC-C metal-binding domain-containing protein [Bacillus thuringiensis]|nr:SEC-C metal-binding domain-containing protein [Bacillus thuringiensis]